MTKSTATFTFIHNKAAKSLLERLTEGRTIMPDRDAKMDEFWYVWVEGGGQWPCAFQSENMARDRAETMAKQSLGKTVHVCKLVSVGTITHAAAPASITGILAA